MLYLDCGTISGTIGDLSGLFTRVTCRMQTGTDWLEIRILVGRHWNINIRLKFDFSLIRVLNVLDSQDLLRIINIKIKGIFVQMKSKKQSRKISGMGWDLSLCLDKKATVKFRKFWHYGNQEPCRISKTLLNTNNKDISFVMSVLTANCNYSSLMAHWEQDASGYCRSYNTEGKLDTLDHIIYWQFHLWILWSY